jgi:predicted NBD/HSP70 family sugar kinase
MQENEHRDTTELARNAQAVEARADKLQQSPVKGSNQVDVRDFNEKLILHLIRHYGQLTKAEATRATGLSPNAISTICRALEADGLLRREAPIRGRIGQPSTPLRLNPVARHYLGFKIGRRSFELIAIDFSGAILARRTSRHHYPTPDSTIAFLRDALRPLLRSAHLRRSDIDAMGIAMPSNIWEFTDDFGAPKPDMDAWRDTDIVARLHEVLPVEISVENDGTAACRAEVVFGPELPGQDVAYFFIGTLVGGGIILNSAVHVGRSGNSGGFGPLRVPDQAGGQRLVDHASLAVLERMMHAKGRDPFTIYDDAEDWAALRPIADAWIARAARALAHAAVSTLAVIDFDTILIDGALPRPECGRLLAALQAEISTLDLQGINIPHMSTGNFGSSARALGAASHWIALDYMLDRSIHHLGEEG